MKKYGYDPKTGSLFSWEFDFQFEGKGGLVPEGAILSEDQTEDEMVGCAYLSGRTGSFIVIHSGCSGDIGHYRMFGNDPRLGLWKGNDIDPAKLAQMSDRMSLCVCGKVVQFPDKLARLCSRFSSSRMYACPLVDELAAFGALARGIGVKPYRVSLCWDNKAPIDARYRAFDPRLEGDALGRMAEVVDKNIPVVNEVMTTIGISPFYGKAVHRDWMPGSKVVVRIVEMDRWFPQVPISAKNYAATTVFVKMETTEQFREQTGYNEAFADVFVATDYVPGVSTFMRFYKTLSGRGFVFVSDQDKVKHGEVVPVFRSDKAYRVQRDQYEQTHGFLRSTSSPDGRSNPV